MDIAETIKVLSAALTPIVAIGAVCIAIQNVRTAKHKIKIDLFEKRMKIFDKLNEVIDAMLSPRGTSFEKTPDYFVMYIDIAKQARWLFDEETKKWLDDNVGLAIQKCSLAEEEFAVAESLEKIANARSDLKDALGTLIRAQHDIVDKFTPHLQLHKL